MQRIMPSTYSDRGSDIQRLAKAAHKRRSGGSWNFARLLVWCPSEDIDQIDALDETGGIEPEMIATDAKLPSNNRQFEDLASVVQAGAVALSPRAVAALVAHPDAVFGALAAAADALLAKESDKEPEIIRGADSRLVGRREAEKRIAGRTRVGNVENLLTSTQLAELVGLKTRQSVHDWLKKGRIIGWLGAKRGLVFPAEQLDERGRPLEGLDRTARQFDDAYTTWCWLTTPCDGLDGRVPITLLRQGKATLVETAAKGHLQGDFA